MSLSRRPDIRNPPLAPPKRTPVASKYENFQPKSEWKDEKGALILFVYLPGFLKEQTRLTRDASSLSIRIYGERPLVDNRFIRFNAVYAIPDNCNINMINTQFDRGTLKVTIPRYNIGSQTVAVGPPPPPPATTPADRRTTSSGITSEPKKSELPSETTAKEASITVAIVDDRQKAKADDGENETAKTEGGVSKGEEKTDQKGPETAALKTEEKGKGGEKRMADGGGEDEYKDNVKDTKGKPPEAIARKAENLEDSTSYTEKLGKEPGRGREMGLEDDMGKLAVNVAAAVLVIMALGAYLFRRSFGSFGN